MSKKTSKKQRTTTTIASCLFVGLATFAIIRAAQESDYVIPKHSVHLPKFPAFVARINQVLGSSAGSKHASAICNPFDQPGFLSFDYNLQTPVWRPTNSQPECPPAPNYLLSIKQAFTNDTISNVDRYAALAEIDYLRNKTILLIGDSVDRNAMGHLQMISGGKIWRSDYLDPVKYNGVDLEGPSEGWNPMNAPHVYHHEELDLMIYNGFTYGLDDKDDFSAAVDWHAPGKVEDRIDQLYLPFTQRMNRQPDFIQLQSGLWDLALFGRQDTRDGVSTKFELTHERLGWWRQRMMSHIKAVERAWPGIPIWLRTTHRVGVIPDYASRDYSQGVEHNATRVQNFFPDLRCKQLVELQRSVAQELCVPVVDFANIWEGWQSSQDHVHPWWMPGGPAYMHPLFTALKMEMHGRRHRTKQFC